jgi:hypothetical protein
MDSVCFCADSLRSRAALCAIGEKRRGGEVSVEILQVKWRNSRWVIGIVLVLCRDGKKRAYLGKGFGDDANMDADLIAAYGALLSYREASAFFPGLKQEEYSEAGV